MKCFEFESVAPTRNPVSGRMGWVYCLVISNYTIVIPLPVKSSKIVKINRRPVLWTLNVLLRYSSTNVGCQKSLLKSSGSERPRPVCILESSLMSGILRLLNLKQDEKLSLKVHLQEEVKGRMRQQECKRKERRTDYDKWAMDVRLV
jgi:hypothetical protein